MTENVIKTGNLTLSTFNGDECETYLDDWNKMISVVNKVEDLEDGKFEVIIRGNRCDIWITDKGVREMLLTHTTLNNKQLCVWRVLVEFLEWYKDNKPKEERFLFKKMV